MSENMDAIEKYEASVARKNHLSVWLSRFALFLSIIAVGIAIIGAVGAGERWWEQPVGIKSLTAAFFLALGVILFTFFVLFYYRKLVKRILWPCLAALILSGCYVGYIAAQIPKATANPLHDISTDISDPPRFETLKLREDNLTGIPGEDNPDYAGMDDLERWKALHAGLYPDLKTLHVFQPVGLAIQRAEQIARENDWEIAMADPVNGRLEATDEVALQKFQDDIVVRAVPDDNGTGSFIDIRSVSRYGQSDLGVNARRIKEFSAQLLEQLGGKVRETEDTEDKDDQE